MIFSIVQDRPSVPPVAAISEQCARRGCGETFTLSYDRPIRRLAEDLYRAGWSLHPSLGLFVCPDHEYGIPVAALPAASIDRPTAPFRAVPDEVYLTDLCASSEPYWCRQCTGCEHACHGGPSTAVTEEVTDDATP